MESQKTPGNSPKRRKHALAALRVAWLLVQLGRLIRWIWQILGNSCF